MDEPKRRQLIEAYVRAYNAFDVEGMLALLAPGVRFENHSGGVVTAATDGVEEFRELAEKSKGLFSEREQRIVSLRFDTDGALADIAYRGCLAADIPDGPSAGTVIELQGRSEFSFEDGRISRIVDRS